MSMQRAVIVGALILAGCGGASDSRRIAQLERELAQERAARLKAEREAADARQPVAPVRAAEHAAPVNGDHFGMVTRETGDEKYLTAVAFSPTGKTVASCGMHGRVRLFSVPNLRELKVLDTSTGAGVENWSRSLCFSPDGKYVCCGSDDRTVWIWESESGQRVQRIRGHEYNVERVLMFPDNVHGLSIDPLSQGLVWSIRTGEIQQRLAIDTGAALSADGTLLAHSHQGPTIVDLSGKTTPRSLDRTPDFNEVDNRGTFVFSSSGKFVAKSRGTLSRELEIWESAGADLVWHHETGHNNTVVGVAFSPDEKYVLATDVIELRAWDVASGDEVGRFALDEDTRAKCMALSPDGRYVVFGGDNGMVTLYRMPSILGHR